MFNFKIILLVLLAAACSIASIIIHHHANSVLLDRAALLQQQSQQLAALQAEQRRLSNLLVRNADTPVADHSSELAKLHAEAEILRKQTNELAQQSKLHATSRSLNPAAKPETHSPEYYEQMQRMRGAKGEEAMYLARGMTEYATDHQNQFPSSLDQIAPYLAKNHFTLSGTNQFEIVYQGSIDQLNGIPWSSIALVRETGTWLTPDGRPARVYGMTGGMGQTVASDDNFQSWEAEHVISMPAR